MRICPELFVAFCLIAAMTPAEARSRMAPAEISLRDGVPCFSIPPKELKRDPKQRFQALTVSDASMSPVTKVWTLQTDSLDGMPIDGNACIGYGQTGPGTTSTTPQALSSGHVYVVSMNVSQSDSSDPTIGYSGRFCVVEDGAQRRLLQVTPDMPAWRLGTCK